MDTAQPLSPREPSAAKPKTVLVVDDSSIMRRLTTEIVEADPDFRVVDVAENGKIALQKVRVHNPDCILLDIEMPELSGLDTMRRLGLRSNSKIVVLSSLGYEGSAERAEALRLGAADVIDKPSGSVSMDIKSARGSVINQTLRRVLGMPSTLSTDAGGLQSANVASAQIHPATGLAMLSRLMALETIKTGVLSFDISAVLDFANPSAARLLAGTALIPGVTQLDRIFEGYNEFVAGEVREVIATGVAKPDLQVDYARPDGEWTPLRFSILPGQGEAGRKTGVMILMEDLSVEKSLRRILDQTMSSAITDSVMAGENLGLDGKTADAVMLFSDIRGFTSISERLDPKALVKMLNEYFTFMADIITANGGIIDKYIGDAIMALFGVPRSLPSNPDAGVSSAIGMLQALELFNEDRTRLGQITLRMGIGLASGSVIAGNIGSPDRKNYTVIGDAVNLASRIESLTKSYGAQILICGRTYAALQTQVPSRRLDVVQVKGQETPTVLYELFHGAALRENTPESLGNYTIGLAHYESGDFDRAAAAMSVALRANPNDSAAAVVLERCRTMAKSPPTAWQGVWKLDSKNG